MPQTKKITGGVRAQRQRGVSSYLSTILLNNARNSDIRSTRQSTRRSTRRSMRASRLIEHTKSVNARYREKLPQMIESSFVNDPLLENVEQNVRMYALRETLLKTIKKTIKLLVESCEFEGTIQRNNPSYVRLFSYIYAIQISIESIEDISQRFKIEKQVLDVHMEDGDVIDCLQMQKLLINLYAAYQKYIKNKNNENI